MRNSRQVPRIGTPRRAPAYRGPPHHRARVYVAASLATSSVTMSATRFLVAAAAALAVAAQVEVLPARGRFSLRVPFPVQLAVNIDGDNPVPVSASYHTRLCGGLAAASARAPPPRLTSNLRALRSPWPCACS